MLTTPELEIVMRLIDVGVKGVGLQIFRDSGAANNLQSALAKFQQMADENAAAVQADAEKQKDAP